ncbi:MAG: glycosyltransferase, partial [Paramuribaculum sp.]
MTEPQPLFSIITVTYNAASTIGPTLSSVAAQTYGGPVEYIVRDVCSTDG